MQRVGQSTSRFVSNPLTATVAASPPTRKLSPDSRTYLSQLRIYAPGVPVAELCHIVWR